MDQYKVNKFKKIIPIFLMLPLVYYLNKIFGVFMGGLLVVACLFCAAYLKKIYTVIFIIVSMLIHTRLSLLEAMTQKQMIVRSIVFFITLIAATLGGVLFNYLNKKIKQKNVANIEFAKSIIVTIIEVIDAKDNYLNSHSKNVYKYTRLIAEKTYHDPKVIEKLCLSALLHDIGKLYISDELLNKSQKLTPHEWNIISSHSLKGVQLLENIPQLDFSLKYVKYHHRHFNGKGYPDNQDFEAIPEDIGIIQIADAFDAMTTDRPYRKAMGIEFAKKELLNNRGSQFNPKYVDLFLELDWNEEILLTEPIEIDFNLIFS